jgi:outer membrane receptor protein involved in Fe transport
MLGTSLVRNRTHLKRASGTPGGWVSIPGIRNRLDEQTFFGEMSRRVGGPFSLTAGARATHYRFAGAGEETGSPTATATPVVGASDWRLLPSMAAGIDIGRGGLAYLRYQESFRPGGAILRSTSTQLVESDHIAAWEAGLRYGTGRLRASFAYSRSRWTDVQADTIDTLGDSATINAGDAIIQSVEASVDWKPLRSLSVSAAGTFNRSRLNSSRIGIITLSDEPLPNVPRAVARGEIELVRTVAPLGEMRLSASARYVGKSRLGIGPILGRPQGEYLDVGAEARIGGGERFLFLKATNLLNEVGNRFALGSVLTVVAEDQVTPLRPRTIRLGIQAAF